MYRLTKALYGLKQASRAWRKKLHDILESISFHASESDSCLYFRAHGSNKVFLLVYVDDLLLAGRNQKVLHHIAAQIAKNVNIRVEKNVNKFLGMVVERRRNHGSIKILSPFMIQQLAEKFGMSECKELSVPIPPDVDLSTKCGRDEGEYEKLQHVPYMELVGSLLHLSNTTRPDIAYACSLLSRYMQDTRRCHWKAAKAVLRYLKGTKDCGIVYSRCGNLHGYTDADFAGDRDDRKSTSGYVFLNSGGAISWRSKKADSGCPIFM